MSNFINTKTYNFRFIFFYCFFLTFLFVGIFYSFDLIIKVTPSDPLQYVAPAINPQGGFPFLDRINLWYYIRFISLFGVSNEYLGGIATLTQTSILLFIILFWLTKKFDMLASSIFFFVFLTNKYWLELATYTYPTQLLSLITIGSVLSSDLIKSEKIKYFTLGSGTILAIFTKVQGFSLFFFILFKILISEKKVIYLKYYFFSLLTSFFIFIYCVYLIDGYQIFFKLYRNYFISGNFSAQFHGINSPNFPNFFNLLKDPLLFFGLISIVYIVISKKNQDLKSLAILACFQILFLLFVYYITQRGGPVISNYFIDSITISLICLSVLLSLTIKKIFLKLFYNNYFKIIICIISLGIFFTLINIFNFNKIKILRINFLENELLIYSIIFFFLLIASIFFIFKFNKQLLILSISIFLIISFGSSHLSVNTMKTRQDWVEPYYFLSHLIKSETDLRKKIIFYATLNAHDVNDAQIRLSSIAKLIFALNKEYDLNICKGLDCDYNAPDTIIITDNLQYINFLKNKNFVSQILIEKSQNNSLKYDLYLLKNNL
jgi:hypothetical protein